MKSKRVNYRMAAALTLVEVLMVLAVIGVLFAVFMPAMSHRPMKAPRIMCTNNLKQIGLAFLIFANDHHEKYPMEIPVVEGGTKELAGFGVVVPHFLVMSNELSTPKILLCAADKRTSASNFAELRAINVSYFVGLDASQTNGQSLLAGDRNITNGEPANNRILLLTANQPVGWTMEIHRGSGDLLLGDGSVQWVSANRLRDQLRASGATTNRLLIP
jgi:competence protein ComGC